MGAGNQSPSRKGAHMTNRTYRPWSHVEDAIIHAHLTDGRGAIQRGLRLAGYDRSLDQIKGRLRRLRGIT